MHKQDVATQLNLKKNQIAERSRKEDVAMMSDGERRHHSNNEQQLQQFQQQYHHDRNDASCGPTPTSGLNFTDHFLCKFVTSGFYLLYLICSLIIKGFWVSPAFLHFVSVSD